MNEDRRPWAFLDASALYPSLLRNILMRLALRDLFRAFWSERVQDEWTRAVLRDRPHVSPAAIERTRRLMDENIDDANVGGYEHLIETVTLPDVDDRHVLAAAIHCGANIIVTANLRDFPSEALAAHGIEAQHPDAFILDLFRTSPSEVVAALRELRGDLVNPPMTASDLLGALDTARLGGNRRGARRIYRCAYKRCDCCNVRQGTAHPCRWQPVIVRPPRAGGKSRPLRRGEKSDRLRGLRSGGKNRHLVGLEHGSAAGSGTSASIRRTTTRRQISKRSERRSSASGATDTGGKQPPWKRDASVLAWLDTL